MALKKPKYVAESRQFVQYPNKVVLELILLHYLIDREKNNRDALP